MFLNSFLNTGELNLLRIQKIIYGGISDEENLSKF